MTLYVTHVVNRNTYFYYKLAATRPVQAVQSHLDAELSPPLGVLSGLAQRPLARPEHGLATLLTERLWVRE